MNVQNLTNQQITLLEIFLNNYKHFRYATANTPKTRREVKSQSKAVAHFNFWLSKTLSSSQKQFLLSYGLLDVVVEVRKNIVTQFSTQKTN